MNEHPSPEFEKEIRETLSASGADPAFVHNLRATLLERANMKKQPRSFYRLAWGLAAAIILIALTAASPRAVDALKRLLGYIPGVGVVEQGSSLRILAAPATVEKDGLQLTILKGAADSERTVLLGILEGYMPGQEPNCATSPRLVLPGGAVLNETQHESGSTSAGSYYERYIFGPMPAGKLDATLELTCATANSDFAFVLTFEAADEAQVMEIIESPTDPEVAPAASAASTLEGFSIAIAEAKPLPDGYLLSGSYEWTDPRFEAFAVHVAGVEISDANGKEVVFQPADLGFADPTLKKQPFAYQVTGTDYTYPLTIKVNAVAVDLMTGSTFQFDAGPEPQVGQVWDVDIDVPVEEHTLHIQTIQLISGDTPSQLGYSFRMTSDPVVRSARIDDADPAIAANGAGGGGGGGGGRPANDGSFESSWVIEGYSPAGLKTFVVSNLTVMFDGAWQTTWQPQ